VALGPGYLPKSSQALAATGNTASTAASVCHRTSAACSFCSRPSCFHQAAGPLDGLGFRGLPGAVAFFFHDRAEPSAQRSWRGETDVGLASGVQAGSTRTAEQQTPKRPRGRPRKGG
jgi:hypothetical protein